MTIPSDILDLLRAPSICFITTLMKDGSPQTTEGGAEHIDQLSMMYTGGPYQNYSGRPQARVILTITAEKTRVMGG